MDLQNDMFETVSSSCFNGNLFRATPKNLKLAQKWVEDRSKVGICISHVQPSPIPLMLLGSAK
eukprot:4968502-Amphidinium_carterae.1